MVRAAPLAATALAILAVTNAGCGDRLNPTVSAPSADKLVSAMGKRVKMLTSVGRPPLTITGTLSAKAAVTFFWESPPANRSMAEILDAAEIDYRSDDGVEALASWCRSPNGSSTPRLCDQALQRAADDYLVKTF